MKNELWGIGVSLATYLTRNIFCVPLNPAVTLVVFFNKRMHPRLLPTYIIGQFSGAVFFVKVLEPAMRKSTGECEGAIAGSHNIRCNG